jgi:hypothetical protein
VGGLVKTGNPRHKGKKSRHCVVCQREGDSMEHIRLIPSGQEAWVHNRCRGQLRSRYEPWRVGRERSEGCGVVIVRERNLVRAGGR